MSPGIAAQQAVLEVRAVVDKAAPYVETTGHAVDEVSVAKSTDFAEVEAGRVLGM